MKHQDGVPRGHDLWCALTAALVALPLASTVHGAPALFPPAASCASILLSDVGEEPDLCPARIYVHTSAQGAGDGTSWQDAYTNLQLALAAACGPATEIWVAEGTYAPAPPNGSRSTAFALAPGVSLYGGFSGTETDLAQRDPVAYPTMLCGDLNGDDGEGTEGRADNAIHVLTFLHPGATARLDGFTVRGGYADGAAYPENYGAGLHSLGGLVVQNCSFEANRAAGEGGAVYNGGNITLTDVRFEANHAQRGGGVYSEGTLGSADVSGCTFVGNVAALDGGAFYSSLASAVFANCTFTDNTASAHGGAIASGLFVDAEILDCSFSGNIAGASGGAVDADFRCVVDIKRCQFAQNVSATAGGAVSAARNTTVNVVACSMTANAAAYGGAVAGVSSTTLQSANCVLNGNSATVQGGGFYFANSGGVLSQVTLYGNTSPAGAGVFAQGGSVQLRNAIVSANAGTQVQASPAASVQYTCITGGHPGTGNLDVDPRFASAADGDLHLTACSPCINAGSNGLVPAGITTDADGNPRVVHSTVDAGAYEFQGEPAEPALPPASLTATAAPSCPRVTLGWSALQSASEYKVWRGLSDVFGNAVQVGTVASPGFEDLAPAAGLTYWYWVSAVNACGESPPGEPISVGVHRCAPPDFNADGHVDLADLQAFVACATGPAVNYTPALPAGCNLLPDAQGRLPADFDADMDIDMDDFAVLQRCWRGPLLPALHDCAD